MKRRQSFDGESEIDEPPLKKHKSSSESSPATSFDVFHTPDHPTRIRASQIIYEDEDFQFEYLWNDEERSRLETLCYLKNIFVTALPKMGAKYVTRHVFDANHRLLACRLKSQDFGSDPSLSSNSPALSKNLLTGASQVDDTKTCLSKNFPMKWPIIGGVCIRPFYSQDPKFAELVFLAVHNLHQHRSVGRKMLRVMKQAASYEGVRRFYTYADNKAIGFFTKLGFRTKNVTKHTQKEKFWAFIKHYDGSELMESVLVPNLNYIHFDAILARQQLHILQYCIRKRHHLRLQQLQSNNDTENDDDVESAENSEDTKSRGNRGNRRSSRSVRSTRNNSSNNQKNNGSSPEREESSDSSMRRSKRLAQAAQGQQKKSRMQLALGLQNGNNAKNGGNSSVSDWQIEMSLKCGQAKLFIDEQHRAHRFKPTYAPLPNFLVSVNDLFEQLHLPQEVIPHLIKYHIFSDRDIYTCHRQGRILSLPEIEALTQDMDVCLDDTQSLASVTKSKYRGRTKSKSKSKPKSGRTGTKTKKSSDDADASESNANSSNSSNGSNSSNSSNSSNNSNNSRSNGEDADGKENENNGAFAENPSNLSDLFGPHQNYYNMCVDYLSRPKMGRNAANTGNTGNAGNTGNREIIINYDEIVGMREEWLPKQRHTRSAAHMNGVGTTGSAAPVSVGNSVNSVNDGNGGGRRSTRSLRASGRSGRSGRNEKNNGGYLRLRQQCSSDVAKMAWFLGRLRNHGDSEPFASAVDPEDAPDYDEFIKEPMDLATMQRKVDNMEYNAWEEFEDDFKLIINNCLHYNGSTHEISKMAKRMKEYYDTLESTYIIMRS